MKKMMILLTALLFLVGAPSSLAHPQEEGGVGTTADRYHFPPAVLMSVLDAPQKAKVNGEEVLCYELLVSNLENKDARLVELQCWSDDKLFRSYSGEQLLGLSRRLAPGGEALSEAVIPANATVVFYLWLEAEADIKGLKHVLSVDPGKGVVSISGAETEVGQQDPVVVGLPFRAKGQWAAIGAPSNQAGHRRAVLMVDGRPWISQRYAIDWIMLGPDGRMAKGDGSRNEDHYCNGVEVLAVADGVIVETYDKVPSNEPSPDKRAVPITLETIGGNWVSLEIAEGRYGMYAHLIPGSLKVKKGDRVKKGDVLGLVGNTGNSTAPHLHFHVSSTPHWINSVGLPYRIDSYRSVGTLQDDEQGPEGFLFVPRRAGESVRTNDLPSEAEVIEVGHP